MAVTLGDFVVLMPYVISFRAFVYFGIIVENHVLMSFMYFYVFRDFALVLFTVY